MDFTVNRGLEVGIYDITKVFSRLERSALLQQIFGGRETLLSVLGKVKIKVVNGKYYMYVDDTDASIVVGLNHLQSADEKILCLDIIHELVHIKQLMDGRDIYDVRYSYVDRQTEIEAYKVAVDEARRLGMKESEITDYLRVDWITEEELRRLAQRLGVVIE